MRRLGGRRWRRSQQLNIEKSDADSPDTGTSGSSTPQPYAVSRWIVPVLLLVFGSLFVAIVVGQVFDIAPGELPTTLRDYPIAAAVMFTLVGGVVAPRQPRNPVGWLFLAIGFSSALLVLGHSYFGFKPLAWIFYCSHGFAYGLLPLPLLFFPDGRLPSRRWRPVVWIAIVAISVTVVGLAGQAWHDLDLSAAAPGGWGLLVTVIGMVVIVLCIVAAVVSLVVRWRRSTGDVRQQLKWLWLGAAVIPVVLVLQTFGVWSSPFLWVLPALTVPAACAVAILKYRLYDIDFFLNRSLVYAILTILVVGGYVSIVAMLGVVFPTEGEGDWEWGNVLAAGAVAMAFGPLRERVQRSANRLLYGDRDDPYTVVSHLAHRLERVVDPGAVLPGVAETVAHALQLPYTAIELTDRTDETRVVASHGRPLSQPEEFPMTYQGQVVGRLLAAPRSPTQAFSTPERTLLADLARQAGLAAHAGRLTTDLQRSRERLVRSREEERRRLRRDLHDGLGPTLAGMTMQVGAARALLAVDVARAKTVLCELEGQLQDCTKEIRHLIEGLRPATLDQLGLLGAIRHHATVITAAPSAPSIELDADTADGRLDQLSAAVEIAAYRIVTEAVTNTVRHAAASHCTIRLTLRDGLLVEIVDDGIGLPDHYSGGVGLTSMRERAEELGGTFLAERRPYGGTRIRALLPLVSS